MHKESKSDSVVLLSVSLVMAHPIILHNLTWKCSAISNMMHLERMITFRKRLKGTKARRILHGLLIQCIQPVVRLVVVQRKGRLSSLIRILEMIDIFVEILILTQNSVHSLNYGAVLSKHCIIVMGPTVVKGLPRLMYVAFVKQNWTYAYCWSAKTS